MLSLNNKSKIFPINSGILYKIRELLSIRRFLGNGFFNFARLIVAPIIGIILIGKDINYILGLNGSIEFEISDKIRLSRFIKNDRTKYFWIYSNKTI